MGRHENLWDYPIHKFILCVGVGVTYWFGNKVVELWVDGKEIDIVSLLIIVEESIMYPRNPTAELFSISPTSICTPLVFISNAATDSPDVFAPGPPVPRTVISLKIAFRGRFEY
mgnify:CR=1 FL=1